MTLDLTAFVLAAPDADASTRSRAAEAIGDPHPGTLLLRTCHRLELVGPTRAFSDSSGAMPGHRLDGEDVARHVLRVAVGLESTVLGEDQILHQLRAATRAARARGPITPNLGRLIDTALRFGRRARSWLPAERPSLADLAIARIATGPLGPGAVVTVIGRGPMGRGLAHALTTRGARVVQLGREGVPTTGSVGIAIALAGPWRASDLVVDELVRSGAWVVDLSAPPAIGHDIVERLGGRLVTIDDLGHGPVPSTDPSAQRFRQRLEALVDEALDEFRAWASQASEQGLARLRAARAGEERALALEALWHRLPDLEPTQRTEIERMAERLSERLLFRL